MIAVVRVRGCIGTNREIRHTFKLLRLKAANHMVIVKENDSMNGMLGKIKNHATFGKIGYQVLATVLEKRGRAAGGRRAGEQELKKTGFKDFVEMARAVEAGKVGLEEIGVKPVFRLGPPKKGFERKGLKKSFREGGALGFRGEKINDLIKRMI